MNKYIKDKHLYLNRNVIKYIPKVSEKVEQKINLTKLVSSRGILNSCFIKSSTPVSSIKKLLDYNLSLLIENSMYRSGRCSSSLKK